MKIEFSLQIFEKCSNIKCNEKLSSGNRVVPCGRTYRQMDGLEFFRKIFVKNT